MHPDESVDFYRPKGPKSKRRKLGKGSKRKKRGPINDATYEYSAERLEIPEAAEIPKVSNPYRQVANPFSFNVSQVGMIPYPIYDPEMYGWAAFRKIGGITLEARGGGGGGGKNKRSLQDKSAEGTKAIEGVEEPSEAPSHQVLTKRGRAKRVFGDVPYEIGLHTDLHREGYEEFVPDEYLEHKGVEKKESKETKAVRHAIEGYFEGREFDNDLARSDRHRNQELWDRRKLGRKKKYDLSTKDLIRERKQLRERKEETRLKDLERDLEEFRQYEKDVEVGSKARKKDAIIANINTILKDDKKQPQTVREKGVSVKPPPKLPMGRQIKLEGRGPRAPFPGPVTPKRVEIKKEPERSPNYEEVIASLPPKKKFGLVAKIKNKRGETYEIEDSFKHLNRAQKERQPPILTNEEIRSKLSSLKRGWDNFANRGKRTEKERKDWIHDNIHAAPDAVRKAFLSSETFKSVLKTMTEDEKKLVRKYQEASARKPLGDQRNYRKISIKERKKKWEAVRRIKGKKYKGHRRIKVKSKEK